jgi:hypothetical protein
MGLDRRNALCKLLWKPNVVLIRECNKVDLSLQQKLGCLLEV